MGRPRIEPGIGNVVGGSGLQRWLIEKGQPVQLARETGIALVPLDGPRRLRNNAYLLTRFKGRDRSYATTQGTRDH
jgi:hypothetical protein